MSVPFNDLQQFREKLYSLLPKRRDAIMNLLDALTSDGNKYNSVVQLSESAFFKRQYSSITDAIADGLSSVDWDEITKLIFQHVYINHEKSPCKFIIDCTPNPRPYSRKLKDKHITHAPNPAPGNKPICVGHQYSVMTLLPDETTAQNRHWLIPVVAKRVQSSQKGNEVGMEELINCINEQKLTDRLCISIADSLYATGKCRETASTQDNLVHIVRLNSTRNVFAKPSSEDHSNKGRKKEFGTKMNLNNVATHLTHDQSIQIERVSGKGKKRTISIKSWNDVLLRGSKEFKSSKYPLNLIQITVTNQKGEDVFKKSLWIAVFGKRRHELELIDIYDNYLSRYDIEHFFRFSKRNLLIDAYQTPDIEHEELWWKFCMLAYAQLYMAKDMVKCIPRTWERYLPEYKNLKSPQTVLTPSQTQKGFANLLTAIGTPAQACVARGKSPGRITGEKQPIKIDQPIIFKTKKIPEQTKKSILSGSELATDISNPKEIDALLEMVYRLLANLKISPEVFRGMLINSS